LLSLFDDGLCFAQGQAGFQVAVKDEAAEQLIFEHQFEGRLLEDMCGHW
jgi:hypothetical protein